MRVKLDDGAYMPHRAHEADAGLDLMTPKGFVIEAGDVAVIDTGVHCQIPLGYYGKLESKSGLYIKHDIVCFGGVIDSGYTGSIVVKLANFSMSPHEFKAGDKIVQMIVQPCSLEDVEEVEELADTERGDGGFGSTGD